MIKRIPAKIVCCLLCCAALLCSCSSYHSFIYKNGFFVDRATGIRYTDAPLCYEPVALGSQYALYEPDVPIYAVRDADPREWLTEDYSGIGGMYYAESVTPPTLTEFGATGVYICVSEVNTISIGEITEADDIAALVDLLENGEDVSVSFGSDALSYSLKYSSERYPFLYYSVSYIKTADGKKYIYNRGSKKTVSAGNLLEAYLPDGDEITGTSSIDQAE